MELHLAAISPKNLAFRLSSTSDVVQDYCKQHIVAPIPEETKVFEDVLPERTCCFRFGDTLPLPIKKALDIIETITSLIVAAAGQNPGVAAKDIHMHFYVPQVLSFVRLRLGEDHKLQITTIGDDPDDYIRCVPAMGMFLNKYWNSNDKVFDFDPDYDTYNEVISDPDKAKFLAKFQKEKDLESSWGSYFGCKDEERDERHRALIAMLAAM